MVIMRQTCEPTMESKYVSPYSPWFDPAEAVSFSDTVLSGDPLFVVNAPGEPPGKQPPPTKPPPPKRPPVKPRKPDDPPIQPPGPGEPPVKPPDDPSPVQAAPRVGTG